MKNLKIIAVVLGCLFSSLVFAANTKSASNLSFQQYLTAIEHGQVYCAANLPKGGQQVMQEKFQYAVAMCGMGVEDAAMQQQAQQIMAAAKKGDANSEYQLGVAYFYGLGVKAQPLEAIKWIKQAAKGGSAQAQVVYGQLYPASHRNKVRNDEQIKQLRLTMRGWYEKAAKQNNAVGQLYYGLSFIDDPVLPHDYATAQQWLQKSIDQGDGDALYEMANFYYLGKGVKQDYAKAFDMYQKAYQSKQVSVFTKRLAAIRLGNMYQFGYAVKKNSKSAVTYYQQAALMGSELGKKAMHDAYAKGSGVKKDPAKAKYWLCQTAIGRRESECIDQS